MNYICEYVYKCIDIYEYIVYICVMCRYIWIYAYIVYIYTFINIYIYNYICFLSKLVKYVPQLEGKEKADWALPCMY